MKHAKILALVGAVVGGLTLATTHATTADAAGYCPYGYYPSPYGCRATLRAYGPYGGYGYYAPRPVYGYGYGYRPYPRPYYRPYAYAPRPYVRFGF